MKTFDIIKPFLNDQGHMNKLFLVFRRAQSKQFNLPSNIFNCSFENPIYRGLVRVSLIDCEIVTFDFRECVRFGCSNSALYAVMIDDLAVQNDGKYDSAMSLGCISLI